MRLEVPWLVSSGLNINIDVAFMSTSRLYLARISSNLAAKSPRNDLLVCVRAMSKGEGGRGQIGQWIFTDRARWQENTRCQMAQTCGEAYTVHTLNVIHITCNLTVPGSDLQMCLLRGHSETLENMLEFEDSGLVAIEEILVTTMAVVRIFQIVCYADCTMASKIL